MDSWEQDWFLEPFSNITQYIYKLKRMSSWVYEFNPLSRLLSRSTPSMDSSSNSLRCTKILSCHNVTFFCLFYLVFFNHVETHLWIIMMESRIVVVQNIVFLKYLTIFYSLFFMGIKIYGKKGLQQGLSFFCSMWYTLKDFHPSSFSSLTFTI